MALPGVGITPSGSAAAELTAITRRAFLPTLTVQLYNSSPFLASLISNAQVMSGGISPVTVPVQGARMTTHQWGDYSASFASPSQQNGIQDAEFATKLSMVPVPFLGMEAAVQVDYAVIPRIEAVMNDAGNVASDAMATSLYTNTGSNAQAFNGIAGLIDDGTNAASFGNINRTANPWWKAKVYNAGGVNPTRQNVAQYINGAVKSCGEVPTYGLMGFGTWTLLQQDFIGQEQYNITPGSSFDTGEGPRSSFRALTVSGVPIFPDFYCPEGVLYLPNSRYMNLYLHEQASFAFTGFESLLSNNQLGYIGLLLTMGELVGTKPSAMVRVNGFNSASI
jgi:hypothetical protein